MSVFLQSFPLKIDLHVGRYAKLVPRTDAAITFR